MGRFVWSVTIGAAALAAGFAASARADAVSDFYKGKRLGFIIASNAGGGYDVYGRMFTRHMERHIPGKPSIVNRNMPGASGLTASNYLYNSAPQDGTEMGIIYNTNLYEPLFGNKSAKYDPRKMGWVGSIGKLQNICVTWHTSKVKTFEQLKEQKAFTVAATGSTGNSAQIPRIFNALLGTDLKVIAGYSTSGQRLALERGEVDGICGLGYSTLVASNPEWFENKRINILIQVGLYKSAGMPNVPMALDYIKDDKNRKVMELLLIRQEWGRPIVTPPNVPAERMAALRTAFDATMKDPKFLAEAEKLKLEVEPLSGQKIDELLASAYGYPPEIIAAGAKLVQGKAQFDACTQFTKDTKQCAKAKKKKKKKEG